MKLISFLKRVFSNPRAPLMREAEAQWPEMLVWRQEVAKDLHQRIHQRLTFLEQVFRNKVFFKEESLKVYLQEFLTEVLCLVNHYLALENLPPDLAYSWEEVEGKIQRLLAGEQAELPCVLDLSILDLAYRDWVGFNTALLAEARNILDIPVPPALVFVPKVIKRSLGLEDKDRRLPYKLQSDLRKQWAKWSPGEFLFFCHPGQGGLKQVLPDLEELYKGLREPWGYEALLEGLLLFSLPARPLVRGLWETTSPASAHELRLVIEDREFFLPKPPPFWTSSVTGLEVDELRLILEVSFRLERYFRSPCRCLWLKDAQNKIWIYHLEFLSGPLDFSSQSLIVKGGVPVHHGVVSAPASFTPKGGLFLVPQKTCSLLEKPLSSIKGLVWAGGDLMGMEAAYLKRLGIPALFQASFLEEVSEGQWLCLDTYTQRLYQGGDLVLSFHMPFAGAGVEEIGGYRLLRRLWPFVFDRSLRHSLVSILSLLEAHEPR